MFLSRSSRVFKRPEPEGWPPSPRRSNPSTQTAADTTRPLQTLTWRKRTAIAAHKLAKPRLQVLLNNNERRVKSFSYRRDEGVKAPAEE